MCVKKHLLQVPHALVLLAAGQLHLLNPPSPHHRLPLESDLPHLLQHHQLEPPHHLPLETARQLVVKGSPQLQHLLRKGLVNHNLPLGFLLLQPEEWGWHQLFLWHFPIMWEAFMVTEHGILNCHICTCIKLLPSVCLLHEIQFEGLRESADISLTESYSQLRCYNLVTCSFSSLRHAKLVHNFCHLTFSDIMIVRRFNTRFKNNDILCVVH